MQQDKIQQKVDKTTGKSQGKVVRSKVREQKEVPRATVNETMLESIGEAVTDMRSFTQTAAWMVCSPSGKSDQSEVVLNYSHPATVSIDCLLMSHVLTRTWMNQGSRTMIMSKHRPPLFSRQIRPQQGLFPLRVACLFVRNKILSCNQWVMRDCCFPMALPCGTRSGWVNQVLREPCLPGSALWRGTKKSLVHQFQPTVQLSGL
jgi:hypothetical protein